MGSSNVDPVNEAHIAKSLVDSWFKYNTTVEGFKTKISRDHKNILIKTPLTSKYAIITEVKVVNDMTTAQRKEWLKSLVDEVRSKQ